MSSRSGSRQFAQVRGWLPIAAVLLVMVIVAWSQMRSTTATTASAPRITVVTPSSASTPRPTSTTRPSPTTSPRAGCTSPREADTVDIGDIGDLPTEALDTLALIVSGGPYPYRQDDGVFSNRERILPKQPKGYYHEYTVVTPGSDDRGARRIIAGECGERWYTDDHYDSFRLIVAAP